MHGGLALRWGPDGPLLPQLTARRRRALAAKRAADIAITLLALLALGPLLLLVALGIRLTSRGPALFRQERLGRGGRSFSMWKFRTMHVERCDPSGVAQTRPADGRVTALGRLLRRTSIDELPQLFNVLAGDMAIIGPRPHVPGMRAAGRDYQALVPYYHLRWQMRPGLSGWAQAHGLRGPTGDAAQARARIDHDIAYIQNTSLGLDLRIIWLTLRHEFLTGNGI